MENRIPALENLANLKTAAHADPTNVEAAVRYWVALSSVKGNDVRSGGYVIEAFRPCALVSTVGMVALVKAYRELFEKNRETPHGELFDSELLQALRARLPELSDVERVSAEWVLSSLHSTVKNNCLGGRRHGCQV